MAEYLIQEETLQGIVDKVKTKTGQTGTMLGSEIEDNIDNILTPTDGSITTKTASDLTASGATVTVPAGYYDSQATKSVSTATQATPSISVSSAGLITASVTQSAGYVSAGTKSATKQLTTQAAKTITPSTSSQTAVASGVYTTGAVTVAAMPTATQATPSISVSSSGLITASATQTAGYVSAGTKSATKQLTTKAATTWTPTTSNQTIASGTYLTGTQTIAGDANLVAENIVSGKSIFGVAGTAVTGGGEPVFERVTGINITTAGFVTIPLSQNVDTVVSYFIGIIPSSATNDTLFSAIYTSGSDPYTKLCYVKPSDSSEMTGKVASDASYGNVLSVTGSTVTFGRSTSVLTTVIKTGCTAIALVSYIPL